MINPITSLLTEASKIKLADGYKNHSLFNNLVREVEAIIKQKKEIVSGENLKLFSVINEIHRSDVRMGGRKAAKQKLEYDVIETNFINPSVISLKNTHSFLPYVAGIYDSQDKLITKMSLGKTRIENTGVENLFIDAWELVTNFDECNDYFGTRPVPNCNQIFNKVSRPIEKTYRFQQAGRYTVRVASPVGFSGNQMGDLAKDAAIESAGDIVADMITLYNGKLGDLVKSTPCFAGAVVKIAEREFWEAMKAQASGNFSGFDLAKLTIKNLKDYFQGATECSLSKGNIDYGFIAINTLDGLLSFIDVFEKTGAVLNLGMVAKGVAFDKSFYEYCVQVETNSIGFCKDSTDTEKLPDEVEQSPTAVSTADPHLTSFDRVSYSFMAVGEFVATKSTANNFQVQVRQSPYPNSTQVSVNTGIAVQAGNDRICVYPNPNRLFINGQSVPLTFTQRALSGGGSIEYAGNRVKVINGSGDLVEIRLLGNDLDYYITPTQIHKGKLSGLFGNYDNNATNDLMLADGKTVANSYASLYPAFSNSWRIKQAESMFVYDAGKTTESYTDLNYPRSEIQLTAAQRTEAEQICRQAGVTEPAALQGCIVDIAMTGNRGFAERAKQNEIFSNAKSVLSVSNFGQYRNEFLLGSGTTINGNTALLPSKGTIRWNDAYLNRNGYETEVILSVNAPSPCLPLFDLEVIDNQATGDPNQNYLRLSANGGQTQVELVSSGVQPTRHPVNLFDGNRHRIRIQSIKALNGSQTTVRLMVYIDQYDPVIIDRSYSSTSLAGYLYPMLKNETLNCSNGQISIHGWSFRSL